MVFRRFTILYVSFIFTSGIYMVLSTNIKQMQQDLISIPSELKHRKNETTIVNQDLNNTSHNVTKITKKRNKTKKRKYTAISQPVDKLSEHLQTTTNSTETRHTPKKTRRRRKKIRQTNKFDNSTKSVENKIFYLQGNETTFNELIALHNKIYSDKFLSSNDSANNVFLTNFDKLNNSTQPRVVKKKSRRRKKLHQNKKLEAFTSKPRGNSTTRKRKKTTFKELVTLQNYTHALNTTLNLFPQLHDNKFSKLPNANTTNSILLKELNRCSIRNGGCSQICKLKGKSKCSCLKGYVLGKNRKKCIDVDECQIRNGGCTEMCRNTVGSYFCACHLGFRLTEDLRSCQDINECNLRNGHGPCQDTCTNTHGSYTCDCSNLKGSRLGVDKHACDDIDECRESNPGCTHLCINTRNGAYCSCSEGMELMSDYKTCQDVDECEDPKIRSTCVRGCVNTVGSYYCEEDFQNDYNIKNGRVPACPPLDLPQHGFFSCLRNNSLSYYDTFTRNGRKIIRNSPGTKCRLECPIGFKLIGDSGFICGVDGRWIVKKKGICIRAPHPQLLCPPDQEFRLENNQATVLVHFPPPRSNIRWKNVTSYPRWAKNLKKLLGEGQHNIQFSVTDPDSKLSSTCSFLVVVKK